MSYSARKASAIWNEQLSIRDNCWLIALNHFVHKTPPDGIHSWDEAATEKWIERYAWEPFEYWSGRDILEQVDTLAHSFQTVVGLWRV